ncbi:MAG: hypothetical protein ACRC0J_21805 [Shewanella oncorhynchi]
MKDIKLTAGHDLDVSTLDLVLIDDADRVRQQLLIKLLLWTGEWFLDTEFGTPYMQDILGKQLTLYGALAAIRKSIIEVDDVLQITSFSHTFSNQTRKLSVKFEVSTPYGNVSVST